MLSAVGSDLLNQLIKRIGTLDSELRSNYRHQMINWEIELYIIALVRKIMVLFGQQLTATRQWMEREMLVYPNKPLIMTDILNGTLFTMVTLNLRLNLTS